MLLHHSRLHTPITGWPAASVASALASVGPNSSLQLVSLGGPPLPIGSLRLNALERLDLRGPQPGGAGAGAGDASGLKADDATVLCAALRLNTSLVELDVRPAPGLGCGLTRARA